MRILRDEADLAQKTIERAETVEECTQAISLLEKVGGYKDTDKLHNDALEKLDTLKKTEIYNEAVACMSAGNASDLKKAGRLFSSVLSWRDSAVLRDACYNKLMELKSEDEESRKDIIYDRAMAIIYPSDRKTIVSAKDYEQALTLFTSINGYRNSEEKIRYCRQQLSVDVQTTIKKIEKSNLKRTVFGWIAGAVGLTWLIFALLYLLNII